MTKEKTYYVYCWTNTRTGEQYVGRGSGRRAFQHVLDSMQPQGGGRLAEAMRNDMYRWFRLCADLDKEGAVEGERLEIRRLKPAYNTYLTSWHRIHGQG